MFAKHTNDLVFASLRSVAIFARNVLGRILTEGGREGRRTRDGAADWARWGSERGSSRRRLPRPSQGRARAQCAYARWVQPGFAALARVSRRRHRGRRPGHRVRVPALTRAQRTEREVAGAGAQRAAWVPQVARRRAASSEGPDGAGRSTQAGPQAPAGPESR